MDSDRQVWVVRAGRGGRYASDFEQEGLIAVDLARVPSIAGWSRETIIERTVTALDEPRPKALGYAAMLVRFADEMRVGDLVVTPDTERSELIVGRLAGDYEYLNQPPIPGHYHVRRVEWAGRLAWEGLPLQVRRTVGAPMAIFKPGAQQALLESLAGVVHR